MLLKIQLYFSHHTTYLVFVNVKISIRFALSFLLIITLIHEGEKVDVLIQIYTKFKNRITSFSDFTKQTYTKTKQYKECTVDEMTTTKIRSQESSLKHLPYIIFIFIVNSTDY